MTNALLTPEVQKTFLQQVLGPRGGLFALGIFVGMFVTTVFMSKYVVEVQAANMNIRYNDLSEKYDKLDKKYDALDQKYSDLNSKFQAKVFDLMPAEN